MKKFIPYLFLALGILVFGASNPPNGYAADKEGKISEVFDGMENRTPPITLNDIRFGASEKNTRLFFDLTEIPDYRVTPKPETASIEIQFFDTKLNPALRNVSLHDTNIRKTEIKEDENQVTVMLHLKDWKKSFVYLPLNSPPRLAFDIRGTEDIKTRKLNKEEAEAFVTPDQIKYIEKKIDVDANLNENKARKLYFEAMNQFSKMKTKEAMENFKKLLEKYPDHPQNDSAMYSYGLLLALEAGTKLVPGTFKPEKYREAYNLYSEALVRFPDTPYRQDIYYANARMLMELDLLTEAIAQLNMLIEDFPKDKYTPRALTQKAFIQLEQGRIDEAIATISTLVAGYGESSGVKEAAFRLADALYKQERYREAFDTYLEAVKHWPEFFKMNPSSIFYLAEIYYMNKDYDNAQDYYFRITNLFPQNENAGKSMNRLSQIYAKKKDYAGSLKILMDAKEKYKGRPEGQETLLRLADLATQKDFSQDNKLLANLPELQNPFKTYEEIIKNTPYKEIKEEAMLSSGVAFSETKQFQKAIEMLKEMLKEYPTSKHKAELMETIKKNFRELIGIYYRQDGFFTVLLTYYRNFEQFLFDIDDPKILLGIARSYREIGVYESAEHFLRKVEKLDKEQVFASTILQSRIDLSLKKKDYPMTVTLANQFLADFPDSTYKIAVLRDKGYAYDRMKDYEKAALTYMQCMVLDKASPEAARTATALGDVFVAEKRYSEAENAYLEAVMIIERNAIDSEKPSERDMNVYQKLAGVIFMQRKYEEAITANQLLLGKFPDFPTPEISLIQIAESQRNLKKFDEARKSYEQIIQKYPQTRAGASANAGLTEMVWEEKNRELLTVKPKKSRQ